jgi:redox-sensitive bicupin YhaK (pirin superfamily)
MTNAQTLSRPFHLRRRENRGVQDLGWSTNRMTFSFSDYYDPDWMGFGSLRVLIESEIDPHQSFSMHPHRNVDILSYVVDGTLRHRDSVDNETDITPGEMQLIRAGQRGILHKETNPQDTPERHYQFWLTPDEPSHESSYHELDPYPEQRRAQLKLYASPDGRRHSMPLRSDAFIYAGLFTTGDTVRHSLSDDRGAWLQVVDGQVRLGDTELQAGDGVGVTADRSHLDLGFTADSNVLLIDLSQPTLHHSS